MTARTGEVQAVARITSVDILRGVAVLAIIVANLPFFAEGLAAQINPNAYGELRGLDWWIWLLTYILVSGRFTAIFAMLFGASIVLRPLPFGLRTAGGPAALSANGRAGRSGLPRLFIWWGDFFSRRWPSAARWCFPYGTGAPPPARTPGSAVVMVAPNLDWARSIYAVVDACG
jgi:hypothetical protein